MTDFDADGDYVGPELIEAGRRIMRVWKDEGQPYSVSSLDFTLEGPDVAPLKVTFREGGEFFMTMAQAGVLGEWLCARAKEATK